MSPIPVPHSKFDKNAFKMFIITGMHLYAFLARPDMEKITHPFCRKSVFSGVLDRNLKKLENRLGVSWPSGETAAHRGAPQEGRIRQALFR